jgi:hypothetical protein
MGLGDEMEITVLSISKVGFVEVGTVVGVSGRVMVQWGGSPADDDVVVRAVYLGMPGAPAFVEARRDDGGHGAAEFWTAEERDVYPGSMCA